MTATTLPRPTTDPTPAERLAHLDAEIAAIDAKLQDPQGWRDALIANRDKLAAQRERVALVATTVLAA